MAKLELSLLQLKILKSLLYLKQDKNSYKQKQERNFSKFAELEAYLTQYIFSKQHFRKSLHRSVLRLEKQGLLRRIKPLRLVKDILVTSKAIKILNNQDYILSSNKRKD